MSVATTESLTGRVALVTGASGSVGQSVCRSLAAAGARLVMQYRSHSPGTDDLAKVRGANGLQHLSIRADFATAQWRGLLAEAIETVGGVDVIVNAAHPAEGGGNVGDLNRSVLAAHFDAVMLHAELAALVLPSMRAKQWGRIIYVSGALMARPYPGMGAYGAAKAAGSVLTRYLAVEEGLNGVTANIVAPGRVVDPNDVKLILDDHWQVLSKQLLERAALGSFPSPNDVADVVCMLALPSASPLTGQTIWVTGGEPII